MSLSIAVLAALLGSCGGGNADTPVPVVSTDQPPDAPPDAPSDRPQADPVTLPAPLLAVQQDPARIGEIPPIALSEIVASSGLEIAFTDHEQRSRIDPLDIARWWDDIQTCVEIVAQAPLVVINADAIDPFLPGDDVLPDPFVGITASGGRGSDGTPLFQVRSDVFDRVGDEAGYPLRLIMSRFLWISDDRPDRDFPYLCAQNVPAERP